jgi:hypothetical protein
MKQEVSWKIFEKFWQNFMKIRPVGAELFHADWQTDRQTDMTDLIVTFRNFANPPKSWANVN